VEAAPSPGFRPAAAALRRLIRPEGAAPLLAGAGAAAILDTALGILTLRAGLGPDASSPTLLAAGCLLAVALLASRALRGPDETDRDEGFTPAGRLAVSGALALAALHGGLARPLAERLASALAFLASREESFSPGFVIEALIPLAIAAPPLAALAAICGAGDRRGARARLGLMASGGAAGLALNGLGWVRWSGGHPLLPALALLVACALIARARPNAPAALSLPGPPQPLTPPSAERQAAFALVVLGGGAAFGLVASALLRLIVLVAGPPAGQAAFATILLLGIALGALGGRPGAPGRSAPSGPLSFYLALGGAMGIVAAMTGDMLPSAYNELLVRWGASQAAAQAAAATVAALAALGIGATAGAAAGAASIMRSTGAWLGVAILGAAAGAAGAPLLIAALGLRSLILAGSSALFVAAGFTALLGEGRLAARGARAVILMLAGAILLSPGHGWALGSFLAAPARQLPASGAVEGERRDRVLLYIDGAHSSAGVAVLEGERPVAFLDGSLRAIAGTESDRSMALAAHLPIVLGAPGGRVLVLGPAMPALLAALAGHDVTSPSIAAGDAAVARLFATAGNSLRPSPSGAERSSARYPDVEGRRVLAASRESWDLIIAPPPVEAEAIGRLAAGEGFAAMRGALSPKGLAAVSLPLDAAPRDLIRAITASFEEAFPGSLAWLIGADLYLVGGREPVVPDIAFMRAAAERSRGIGILGLEDPLRILAHGMRSADLALPIARRGGAGEGSQPGGSPAAGPPSMVATSLEWLAGILEREAPSYELPAQFSERAAAAVAQRLAVLREVARLTARARIGLITGQEALLREAASAAGMRDPSDFEARLLLARAAEARGDRLLAAGERQGARAAFREALESFPGSISALTGLAWIRYGDGDRAGAEQLLRRAAREAPWIAQTWYRLGLIRHEAGEPAAARDLLGEAHWLDPSRPEPLILLGDIAVAEGNLDQARSLYVMALACGSRTVEIRSALAGVSLLEGDLPAARGAIEEALAGKPGDPEALMMRARIRMAEGDRDGARHDLLAAVTTGGASYRARALLDPSFRAILLGDDPAGDAMKGPVQPPPAQGGAPGASAEAPQ
jgi:Flp pilus assembly protein TadD